MPVKPSTANPELPVYGEAVKAALASERVSFEIRKVSSFRSPRYGPTWRLTIARLDTGEIGLLLLAANAVRDETFGEYQNICEAGDAVGPCVLARVRLPNGRETWDIGDAPDAASRTAQPPAASTPPAAKPS